MKILGSGKLDDFNKVPLSEKTVKALGVKSGDSILFSKGTGHTVQMFRAEGANLTSEADLPPADKNDNKAAVVILAITLLVMMSTIFFLFYAKIITLDLFKTLETWKIAVTILLVFAAVILLVAAIVMQFSHKVKSPEAIVSFSGPYSKKRLFGLSKMTSDGRTVTGNLYVNALFATNPSHVEARVTNASGVTEPVLVKCTKDVPGYCTYRLRIQYTDLSFGKLDVAISYIYSGKAIVVKAVLPLSTKKEDSMTVHVEEGEITAELVFGPQFQTAKFDETLFDPQEEGE